MNEKKSNKLTSRFDSKERVGDELEFISVEFTEEFIVNHPSEIEDTIPNMRVPIRRVPVSRRIY